MYRELKLFASDNQMDFSLVLQCQQHNNNNIQSTRPDTSTRRLIYPEGRYLLQPKFLLPMDCVGKYCNLTAMKSLCHRQTVLSSDNTRQSVVISNIE